MSNHVQPQGQNPLPRNGRYARLEMWILSIISVVGLLCVVWVLMTKLT